MTETPSALENAPVDSTVKLSQSEVQQYLEKALKGRPFCFFAHSYPDVLNVHLGFRRSKRLAYSHLLSLQASHWTLFSAVTESRIENAIDLTTDEHLSHEDIEGKKLIEPGATVETVEMVLLNGSYDLLLGFSDESELLICPDRKDQTDATDWELHAPDKVLFVGPGGMARYA